MVVAVLITSIGTGVTGGYAPIGRSGTLTTIITVKRALGNIGLIVAHTIGNFLPQSLGTGWVVNAALTLGAIDARCSQSTTILIYLSSSMNDYLLPITDRFQ